MLATAAAAMTCASAPVAVLVLDYLACEPDHADDETAAKGR